KEGFLHIYPAVHQQALSSLNITSGFSATGLIPFSPERFLSKIPKTPTPPSTPQQLILWCRKNTSQFISIGRAEE
ncbi:hypothetical protein, partial [Salmonella enterica]|uniref:hypothetical protein n=1 Tax=Salmonella enterica TaxID=28901 RepID=UPI003CEA61AB